MREERGFTLVELMIGMVIVTLLIGAIGSALVVSLRTTDVTNQRMSVNHDVQITSAYLANDVQSTKEGGVTLSSGGNCSGAPTTLVTFAYASGQAVYACGLTNGETRVTRTFGGTTVVLAHFAGASRPTVTCMPNADCTGNVDGVSIVFTKANGCTTDCNYTLFGSRRSFNSATAGDSTPGTADTTLLSTGASSPLWVQGSCPDPGTTSGCIIDSTKTALPISDVQTTDWLPTPLWTKLSDADTTTAITSAAGRKTEARVLLGPVDPPDPGVLPTVEFHAVKVGGSSPKVTLSLYNGSTPLTSQANIGPINQSKSYDWLLTAAQTAAIPSAAYAHLTLGISVANASGTDSIAVDGVAFDSFDLTGAGLLTIKGSLYVNSQLSSAVRLTGSKTATKISITNGGNFLIWSPGACAGCNHNTVSCSVCTWVGNQPWTSYANSIPDPLRSLPAPDPSTMPVVSCPGSTCSPGVYQTTLSKSSNTALQPGIYYLQQGLSITGTAALTCAAPCTGGVMLYIAGGSVTFAGSSLVSLPALNSKVFAGGLYDGIVMFQARADTNEVKFAGNSGSTTFCTIGGAQYGNCLNGIVYVPNSIQVTLATGSASLATKAIVAQNIKVSSAVSIG